MDSPFVVYICSLSVWPLVALQIACVTGKRLSWPSCLIIPLLSSAIDLRVLLPAICDGFVSECSRDRNRLATSIWPRCGRTLCTSEIRK